MGHPRCRNPPLHDPRHAHRVHGEAREFHGWLELNTALEALSRALVSERPQPPLFPCDA
jgi:hypothetical protein